MAINYHAIQIGRRYATCQKKEDWLASGVATTDFSCVGIYSNAMFKK